MLRHITTIQESGSPVYSRLLGGYHETDGGTFTGFKTAEVEAEPFTGFEAGLEEGEVFTGFEADVMEGEIFTGFEADLMEGENFTGFWNRKEVIGDDVPGPPKMH
jgi:hypothetical protein